MKPRNLVLAILLTVVLALVLTVGGLLLFNTRRMLPQHAGLAYLDDAIDPVEIVRDEYGIPHIYASSVYDLFYTQGYVHAQDRWWQMEMQRHIGQGRVEELTGFNPSALGNDLFIRTAGWNRSSEADLDYIADETRDILDAYAAGVNAYIDGRHGGGLALEYTLMGVTGVNIEVEPWTTLDSLSWAKVMAWGQSGNMSEEMERQTLHEVVGEALTNQYAPMYPFDVRPTILTPDDLPLNTDTLNAPLTGAPQARTDGALAVASTLAGGVAPDFAPMFGDGVGSNSWVISGDQTASGAPILANDPHLGIQMPSIWYEVGLHCRPVSEACPYDAVGFSLAGTPTLLIGHNQHIAWGLTNAMGDVQDLYMIRVNPDNPLQYEYNGEWRDMDVVTETIAFGGSYTAQADDPATDACEGITDLPVNADGLLEIQVRLTHFGPIITDNSVEGCTFIAMDTTETPLALRWTGLEPVDLISATNGMNKAANWADFRAALTHFETPSINFVYADVDGNIGYQLPFHVPVRAEGHDGRIPVPGWTDEYEWRGYIPYDDLPRILNPERGWIVTANHGVVPAAYYDQLAETLGGEFGDDASYLLGTEYAFGYRGQRIVDLVSSLGAHTIESVAEIQADNYSIHAAEVQPYLAALSTTAESDATLSRAVTMLLDWDLQNDMDSPQAALFQTFWVALVDNMWVDDLGFMPDGGGHLAWATQVLLDAPDDPIWDNGSTDTPETRDDILVKALQDAVDYLTATQGEDWDAWRWGDLHTATFVSTPLGQSGIGFVEGLVNAGPVATSGGWETVNRTNWYTDEPFIVQGSISSLRMIVDLGDLDASLSVHTTGQSGHPFSPHYTDMVDLWRNHGYHPMRFGEEAVEAGAASRMTLRPSPIQAEADADAE